MVAEAATPQWSALVSDMRPRPRMAADNPVEEDEKGLP